MIQAETIKIQLSHNQDFVKLKKDNFIDRTTIKKILEIIEPVNYT